MSKFVTVDALGNIDGMYLEDPGGGIELSDEEWQSVGPGYKYTDGKLIAPAPKTAEQIQQDEDRNKIASNELKKQALMQEAGEKISVLQDSVDLSMSTEDEKNQLVEWKKYRVLLNRIDTSTVSDLTWPAKPA
ncbi:tail fiber assembly protein [Pantoea ananatis]|uniref:tail fiber assembly protein n=1 Tax=Pantoea ananas TaxID=553 RepID=UPI000CEB3E55|nr:tail fiber assembly protein [Pantoea ananatis]AVG77937.1 tail fiber assembly protein [Pantoea ananatis]